MVHLSSLTSWLSHPLTTRWRMPSADARIFAPIALILLNWLRQWRKLGTGGANSWTTSLPPSSGYLPRPPAVAFTTGSSFRRPVPCCLPLGPGRHTCSPSFPLMGRRSTGPSPQKDPGTGAALDDLGGPGASPGKPYFAGSCVRSTVDQGGHLQAPPPPGRCTCLPEVEAQCGGGQPL